MDLVNKEIVNIGKDKIILSSIPAFKAQRILIKGFSAIQNGNIADISDDVLQDILKYAGIVNSNGGEVMLENEDIIETMITDPVTLIDIETRMVEKNFGFLGDGRFKSILSRLTTSLAHSTSSETPNI